MLENGLESDDDDENDDHFYPPSFKRLRFEDDCLLAEVVLANAENVQDSADGPQTYQEVIASDLSKWSKAMEEELKVHKVNGSWFLYGESKTYDQSDV